MPSVQAIRIRAKMPISRERSVPMVAADDALADGEHD